MATITRWDPWADLATLQREVNNLFARGDVAGRADAPLVPIDAYRDDDGVVVSVDVPGVTPDAVDVSVDDGVLIITAERRVAEGVADDAWLRRERPAGRIERSFSLPQGTDPDAISAAVEHGVLHIRVPHPEARKPRRIAITEGDGTTIAVD